ncbi:MAG TPA: zinc ribbon domain-containing protein [Patescibacteria group bacterium]|jgi:hypothetical protein|nr:zinc ribbon domain-containing protein [Patescibacteria group bacterium]
MEQTICPFCHFPLSQTYYFCPNCGKKISEPPITILKQIGVYLLSIFLPPLGLWPGIRYLLSKNQKTKKVGAIAIFLTILSTIITLWISVAMFNNLSQSLSSQVNQYQNLGY